MNPKSIYVLLNQLLAWQNRFQSSVGHSVAWLTLLLVVLASLAVGLRYGFDFSSTKLDESLLYVHGLIFMLGLAYTYQQNQHVRVDVFYERASKRRKDWINLLGAVFFVLPMMLFILWSGWDYVAASWAIQERSVDASGLAYLYLLKSVILISAGLVLLQTLAFIVQYSLALFAPDQLNPQAQAEAFQDHFQEGI
ncbi:TRAP transporter small permease subunit [Thiomicrospira sp.]|uniref:TRAP transporter small permease subunit n=1 Tax=Thiomicrospira sp. TaxID=935 RepID=UPI002F94C166